MGDHLSQSWRSDTIQRVSSIAEDATASPLSPSGQPLTSVNASPNPKESSNRTRRRFSDGIPHLSKYPQKSAKDDADVGLSSRPWDDAGSQVDTETNDNNPPPAVPEVITSNVLEPAVESSDKIPAEIKSVLGKAHNDENSDDDDSDGNDNSAFSPEESSALGHNGYGNNGRQTTTQALSDTPEIETNPSNGGGSFRIPGYSDTPSLRYSAPSRSGANNAQKRDNNELVVGSSKGQRMNGFSPLPLVCWYAAKGHGSQEVRRLLSDHFRSKRSPNRHLVFAECQLCERLFIDESSWEEHKKLLQSDPHCRALEAADLNAENYEPNQRGLSPARMEKVDKAVGQYKKDDEWINANYELYMGRSSITEQEARFELGKWLVAWYAMFPDEEIPSNPFTKLHSYLSVDQGFLGRSSGQYGNMHTNERATVQLRDIYRIGERSDSDLKRANANESIEHWVRVQAAFSDSGFASMPSLAAPSISNRADQTSIQDEHNIDQLPTTPSDYGDNQILENEHILTARTAEVIDDDLQSIVSDRDEIFSQISTQKSQQELLAIKHLAILFTQNEDLKPFYEIALERMEKGRFVNNFRRILKRYYHDLSKSANTNFERATVYLLSSRSTRVRIAQDVIYRLRPESHEAYTQLLADTEAIKDKISDLERWIASNPDLVPPLEPQDSRDIADNSDSDQEDEEQVVTSYHLPNVAEMESFLFQGNPFHSLITNTCLFLLPAALTSLSRVLMTIPYNKIYFSSEDNLSIINRVQGFIEDYTEENWNWWPLQPRMRQLEKDQTRVYWKCHCNRTQWAEISLSQANLYRLILQQNRTVIQNNHLCRSKREKSWRATLREMITKTVGSFSTRTQPLTTPGIAQPLSPEIIQLEPSGSRVRQTANILYNPARPTTNDQSGVRVDINELSGGPYVLFGVKGPRRTLELEQIEVNEGSDDDAFFQSLMQAYRKHRGFWRYWFSVWQLSHCDFVKFLKLRANRIIYHSKSLPEDILYEYQPRPPTAENPPILPHEFELAFSACSSNCRLSTLHDCVDPPIGKFAVERIPKRKSMIHCSTDNLEFAWGIQAQHAISALRMAVYHLVIFASTFGFWAWWLVVHPNDLQNAAVPLTTMAVLLSMFWGGAGVLKFREQD